MHSESISGYPPLPGRHLRLPASRSSRKGGGTAFFCALVFFLWVVVVIAMVYSENPIRGLITAATAIAIFSPVIARTLEGHFDLFEPIVPATVALTSMFVVRPLSDQALSYYVHLGYNFHSTFDETLVTVLVGCVAFSVGYLSNVGTFLRRIFPNPGLSFPRKKVIRAAIVTGMLGLTLYGVFIATSGGLATLALFLRGRSMELDHLQRNSTGYLYQAVGFLVPASFSFLAAWLHFRRRSFLILATLAAAPIVTLEIAQGTRSDMLPFAFGFCALYYLYKQRRPTFKMLIAFGILVLGVSTLLREMRNAPRKDLFADAGDVDDARQSLAGTFSSGGDDEMFDTLAIVSSIVPSKLPYDPLAVITDLTSRVLPRTLFPNKPMEATDKAVIVLWPQRYQRSRGSAASSILGNFYVYGGVAAVAIGCFGIGVLLNQIWKWYLGNSNNLNAILLYSFVPGLVVVLLRGTTVDTLDRMFYLVLPLVVQQIYWRKG
jgi:hypothetical protein